jgi:transcriptional regulator GlxA family with amidase domain
MADFLDPTYQCDIAPQARSVNRVVKRIGIALFSEFGLLDIAVVVEAFHAANVLCESLMGGRVQYEVSLLSAHGGRVSSSSSVLVRTESNCIDFQGGNFCALFIAGGTRANADLRDERVLGWLRNITQWADVIFPIAEGRLLLDAAGMTRSVGAPRRNAHAPQIELYGFRSRRVSETNSPVHAALAVVESDLGGEIVRQIAKRIEPTLENQFTAVIRKHASSNVSEKIRASARWIEMNCNRSIMMDEAAQVAAMSGRNFLRRFRLEIGVAPSDYLLYVRLDLCCRLLIDTDLPVDKVARRCGIGSGGQLSKIFRKHIGRTPTEYRADKE